MPKTYGPRGSCFLDVAWTVGAGGVGDGAEGGCDHSSGRHSAPGRPLTARPFFVASRGKAAPRPPPPPKWATPWLRSSAFHETSYSSGSCLAFFRFVASASVPTAFLLVWVSRRWWQFWHFVREAALDSPQYAHSHTPSGGAAP